MNYEELALKIIKNVGGEQNVINLYNCVTRLRFTLKDNNKANKVVLEGLEGVLSVVQSAGQYQVIIGSDVNEVYKAIISMTNFQDKSENEKDLEEESKLINKIFTVVSGIFAPYLPAIAASGILKGLLALFTSLNWLSTESGTYHILSATSNAIFYFFPIFLAFTAAKQFGANPYIATVIGAALLEPNFASLFANGATKTSFLGIPTMLMDYASSVIPVILAVWLYSYLEKRLNRVFHKDLRMILTPLIALVVTVPVTLIMFGPVSVYLSEALGAGMTFIGEKNGILTGIIAGGLLSFLPLFGLQWGIIPILLLNHSTYGYDTFNPMWVMGTYAQMGIALGIYIKATEKTLKSYALSSFFTGILAGVTEPILYGIVTKYKRTFYPIILGGAISGAIIGAIQVKQHAFAFAGILAFPTFFGATFWWYILGILVAISIPALFVILWGFEDKKKLKETSGETGESVQKKIDVYSPIRGEVIKLESMSDEVFSSKVMGEGIAIIPSDGKVFAPIDGKVTTFFPTKHAIGITSDKGAEILIHVGIDTVQLKGEHFTAKVEEGNTVKKGDLLMEFNISKIREEGYEITTPIVITNTSKYLNVINNINSNTIEIGDKMLVLES